MSISIGIHLHYGVPQPCDLLLQIEPARLPGQEIEASKLILLNGDVRKRLPAEEGIGSRVWIHAETAFACRYACRVRITRDPDDIAGLSQDPLPSLAADIVRYLMPSRYCHPDQVFDLVTQKFDDLSGGALIMAARDWIETTFTYDAEASDSTTTAHETVAKRRGVCRDYAHVLIAIARAAAIPARIVSVYAPDVTPPDFHAVAEVYLEGAWHLVDATGMARIDETVVIGVGRDAADVSFLTAYGLLEFREQTVEVSRIA